MSESDTIEKEILSILEELKNKICILNGETFSQLMNLPSEIIDFKKIAAFSLTDDLRSESNSPLGQLIIADSYSSSEQSSRAGSISKTFPTPYVTKDVSNNETSITQKPIQEEPQLPLIESNNINEKSIETTSEISTAEIKLEVKIPSPSSNMLSVEKFLPFPSTKITKNVKFTSTDATGMNGKKPPFVMPASTPDKTTLFTTKPSIVHSTAFTVSTSTTSTTVIAGLAAPKVVKKTPQQQKQQQQSYSKFRHILPAVKSESSTASRPLKPKPTSQSKGILTSTVALSSQVKSENASLPPSERCVKEVVADMCRDQLLSSKSVGSLKEKYSTGHPAVKKSKTLTTTSTSRTKTSPIKRSSTHDDGDTMSPMANSAAGVKSTESGSTTTITPTSSSGSSSLTTTSTSETNVTSGKPPPVSPTSTFDSVMSDVIHGRATTSLEEMHSSDLSLPLLKKLSAKQRARQAPPKNGKNTKRVILERTNNSIPDSKTPSRSIIPMSGQFIIQSPCSSSTSGVLSLIASSSSQSVYVGSAAQADGVKTCAADSNGGVQLLQLAKTLLNGVNVANGGSPTILPPNLVPTSLYLHVPAAPSSNTPTTTNNILIHGGGSVSTTTRGAAITNAVSQPKFIQPKILPTTTTRNILPNPNNSGKVPISLASSVRMSTTIHASSAPTTGDKGGTPTSAQTRSSNGAQAPTQQLIYLSNGNMMTFGNPPMNGTIQNAGNGIPRFIQLTPAGYMAVSTGLSATPTSIGGPVGMAMISSPTANGTHFLQNGAHFPEQFINGGERSDAPFPSNLHVMSAQSSAATNDHLQASICSVATQSGGGATGAMPIVPKGAVRRKRKNPDGDLNGGEAPPLLNYALDAPTLSSDASLEEEENEPPPLLLQDEAVSMHSIFLKEAALMRQHFLHTNGAKRRPNSVKHYIDGLVIEESSEPFPCANATWIEVHKDLETIYSDEKQDQLSNKKVKKDALEEEDDEENENEENDEKASSTESRESDKARVGRRGRRRGRPRVSASSEASPVEANVRSEKRKTPSSTTSTTCAQLAGAKRGRKPGTSREISGLLKMDFGPGKTPFPTTSPELYREEVMLDVRQQQRCLAFDARLVRPSPEARSEKTPPSSSHTPPPTCSSSSAKPPSSQTSTAKDAVEKRGDDDALLDERCSFCQQKFTEVKRRHPTKPQYCSKDCWRKYKERKEKERSFRQFEIGKSPQDDEKPADRPVSTTTTTTTTTTMTTTTVPVKSAEKSSPHRPQPLPTHRSPGESRLQKPKSSPGDQPIAVLAKRQPCTSSPPTLAAKTSGLHAQRGINSPPSSAFQIKMVTPPRKQATIRSNGQKMDTQPQTTGARAPASGWGAFLTQPPVQQPPGVVSFISPSLIYGVPNVATPTSSVADYGNAQHLLSQQQRLQQQLQQCSSPSAYAVGYASSSPSMSTPTPPAIVVSGASALFRSAARPSPLLTTNGNNGVTPPPIGSPALTLPPTTGMNSAERNAELNKLQGKGVLNWTTFDVARWASLVTNSDVNGERFFACEIRGEDLSLLDAKRMQDYVGLKLGPAMKLNNALNALEGARISEECLCALYAENGALSALNARGYQNWTADEVGQWASIVTGSSEVGDKFIQQEIDGDSLKFLETKEFRDVLGFKLGHILRLEAAISMLK